MEVSNWKSQAQDWLAALGYPYASIETPMDDRIGVWWDYYRTEADFYTHEQQDINGKPHKVKVRSMTPGKMVCEDMAGLLFNERATISTAEDDALKSADAWLQKWLGDVRFQDRAPQLIQHTCATGTGAWALHLRGVQTMGKSAMLSVTPQRYDARHIAPLDWDGDTCLACAFVSRVSLRGEPLTQVEVHRPQDGGNYEIMCRFFGDDGKVVVPDGYTDGSINTKQQAPTFQLITLALDNVYWEFSPFGVSLFDEAIGALETTDLAFDNIGNDIFLGKKMLMIPSSMMTKNQEGDLMLPQDEGRQFFVALQESNIYDGKAGIVEYNPTLRAEEDALMLSKALQVLGKRVGFGTKYYSLDDAGGITTAKEVASDNSEMMRTVHRHEHMISPAIEGIVTAAANIYRSIGTVSMPDITGSINVVMGDSIIQDEDSMRDRDRADVAAGLLESWKYMMRWQGYSEDEARAAAGADAVAETPEEF